MFARNQGEVCTCPSRALVQGGIYDEFVAQGVKRAELGRPRRSRRSRGSPTTPTRKHTHLTVDVVSGRGSGFSVEAPEGVRFIIRSWLLTDDEMRELGDL